MLSISDDHLAPIRSAVERSTDGVRRTLDPRDPGDAAAIRAFLQLTGKTEQTHPGLYGDLAAVADGSASAPDDGGQVLDIVDSGRDAQGRATARVWHQDRTGGHLSGSLALALDADSGAPVAFGYANRVGGGLAPAATRSATAEPAPANLTTIGFAHSQSTPDSVPAFSMVSQTAPVTSTGMIDANVTAPVSTTHASVQIGLGRPNPGNDLDYFYKQDTNDHPQLVVPFTGTVNVQQPLANVGSGGQFTSGLVVSTQLYSLKGASYIAHLSSQSLTTQITGDTSTNVVTWSYPYDPDGTPGNYTSLMYNGLDAANDSTTAFFFSFQIPVDNPVVPTFDFNVCSFDWPEQPSVNCYQIQDLQFWWHCLAEGTEVTLADGSTLPIERVDNTVRVRTGDNGSLGVEATTRGLHKAGALRLSTRDGQSLVLTAGHPVGTPDGLRRAGDLVAGDEVLTGQGSTTVATVESIDYDGVFANLKLVDEQDRARGLGGAVGTFLANGIVVGDFESMAALHERTVHSLEYMRARIPERYHTDYASTLADIARDNARYGGTF
ncbi:MAG TPA: Hint domain-containing protein [Jatrophihabitans sp.]|nr:Hint domain-containing protein [Jatrophihabitans sp.]